MDLEEFFSVDGGTNTSNGLEHQAQDEAAARAAMLDPRELERALRRQNAQRMVECEDHFTDDAWEIDFYISNHPNTNPQPHPAHNNTPSNTLPPPPQVLPPQTFNMDPNDPNQQYYYQPSAYTHYSPQQGQNNPYAASSSASNPTSPQNGFIPIYTSTPQDPSQSSNQYATYASSSSSNTSPQTLEEHELKRLRNTAASARFRAKKKQREAQLETSAKEKKERLEALEKRIHDLEEENKWLKALIMEKKDVAGEVQRLRDRFGAVAEEMKEFEHKDGVGTGSSKGKHGKK